MRYTPVFGIEADEVYSYRKFPVGLQQAGCLQHDGYAAGSVVGSHDRLLPVGGVGVVVGPRTAVPVRTDQYPLLCLRVKTRDDVRRLQQSSVVSLQVGLLFLDFTAELPELLCDPFSARLVCRGVHCAWSEAALCCRESVCRIGIELRAGRLCRCHGVGRIAVVVCFPLAAVGYGRKGDCQKAAGKEFCFRFHCL